MSSINSHRYLVRMPCDKLQVQTYPNQLNADELENERQVFCYREGEI